MNQAAIAPPWVHQPLATGVRAPRTGAGTSLPAVRCGETDQVAPRLVQALGAALTWSRERRSSWPEAAAALTTDELAERANTMSFLASWSDAQDPAASTELDRALSTVVSVLGARMAFVDDDLEQGVAAAGALSAISRRRVLDISSTASQACARMLSAALVRHTRPDGSPVDTRREEAIRLVLAAQALRAMGMVGPDSSLAETLRVAEEGLAWRLMPDGRFDDDSPGLDASLVQDVAGTDPGWLHAVSRGEAGLPPLAGQRFFELDRRLVVRGAWGERGRVQGESFLTVGAGPAPRARWFVRGADHLSRLQVAGVTTPPGVSPTVLQDDRTGAVLYALDVLDRRGAPAKVFLAHHPGSWLLAMAHPVTGRSPGLAVELTTPTWSAVRDDQLVLSDTGSDAFVRVAGVESASTGPAAPVPTEFVDAPTSSWAAQTPDRPACVVLAASVDKQDEAILAAELHRGARTTRVTWEFGGVKHRVVWNEAEGVLSYRSARAESDTTALVQDAG